MRETFLNRISALICTLFSMVCLYSLPVLAATPSLSALVIGNASYVQDQLPNPVQDAKLMADTLAGLGFAVTQSNDLDRSALFSTVRQYTESLKPGAISVVYYAGHGMQIQGGNYLIPVDMVPTSEKSVKLKAYPLENLLDRLKQSQSAVNIVILDACRNNPFRPKSKTRGFNNMGLAKVIAPKGTLIAYSTQPGQQAEDGTTGNSLYTKTLAQEMIKNGQNIEQVFKQVAEVVRKKTFDDQQPWFETSLIDDYYFAIPDGVQMVTRPTPTKLSSDKVAGLKRGLAQPKSQKKQSDPQENWYLDFSDSEWNQFDWEVNQRVKRATEDEVEVLEYRAKAGNVVAQTTLGVLYRMGTEKMVDQTNGRIFRSKANNTKSIYWLQRAAEAGFPMAQTELGEMYYLGQGLDKDLVKAEAWLEKAAVANYPRARLDLAQVKATLSGSTEDMRNMANELMRSISGQLN